ncbi:histidine phosphatase family protein [Cohnella soli]|uniref:Histidine phosphatase family protein n=1 Tax=Cohnella soli TaxID=425005 RepID=A0ABW0HTN8_9BACL
MKIGLVRHFKVKQAYPFGRSLSACEVDQWFRDYDEADIEEGSTDLGGIEWDCCYASDLPRAIRTAEKIHVGPIYQMAELREIPAPTFETKFKLSFVWWALLIRMSWLINRQTRQDIRHAKARINKVLDQAIAQKEGNVLIVSHAALMKFLRKELLNRGFKGPGFGHAKNGMLYVFEMRKGRDL